jgi:cytochrome b pre-mRNA-processing protein 3
MALGIFKKPRHLDAAHALYAAVVTQARRPEFYAVHGVPDTVDGRFDLIALHAFLVMRRLKRIAEAGGEGARAAAGLSQALFDLMFADMDQNLREMGVGDLSVGKKVKRMATAFYGRVAAYDEGLEAAGERVLEEGLRRNLFGTVPGVSDAQLKALAAHVRREAGRLDGQGLADFAAGRVSFGGPDE